MPVAEGRPSTFDLVAAAQEGLKRALDVARAGSPLNQIGGAVEQTVRRRGYAVCPELMGHGIGRRIHEEPEVANHYVPGASPRLTDGLVITIEPIISAGSGAVRPTADGWTIKTSDGAMSAHVEHTVVITDGAPLILTA